MGNNLRKAISVPNLTGGVNFKDALNLVDDNQMTDCKNVWFKDGVLQTRPMMTNSHWENRVFGVSKYDDDYEITFNSTQLEMYKNGAKVTVYIRKKRKKSDNSGAIHITLMNEQWGGSGMYYDVETEFGEGEMPTAEVVYSAKSIKENGTGIFLLCTKKPSEPEDIPDEVNLTIQNKNTEVIELFEVVDNKKSGGYKLELLTYKDLYIPTVYINGKSDGFYQRPISEQAEFATPSLFEGYNSIFWGYHDFCFTPDADNSERDFNVFTLPVEIKNTRIKIIYRSLSETPILDIGETNFESQEHYWYDEVYISADIAKRQIKFSIKKDGKFVPYGFTNSLGKEANILKFRVQFLENKNNMCGMKFGMWFGGEAEGVEGGTRLFISGSENNPNLVMWSDLNNPTYFSENNYVYVGEESQAITSLQKQGDMLVIFKQNSIFYSTYSIGKGYTFDDVIQGKVFDVTTLDATFPVTQISDGIGCDLPQSIQLCNNRLVWATGRKVYMLNSLNQYNKNNVIEISAMCENKLREIRDFALHSSCQYQGHYILSFDNHFFVLDYDHYYFNNAARYSDTQKRQKQLVWYYWEIPNIEASFYALKSSGDFFYMVCAELFEVTNDNTTTKYYTKFYNYQFQSVLKGISEKDQNYGEDVWLSSKEYILEEFENENTDWVTDKLQKRAPIETMVQTKMFDFGAMERFKSIEQVYLGLGKTPGDLNIEYLTENGSLHKGYIEICENKEINTPDFITTKRLLPGIKRALKFGVRITAKGRIALEGILIKFKYMGVKR